LHQKNKYQSTSQVFSEIYAKNQWGGGPGQFYSGPGSDGVFAKQFCGLINDFIISLKKDNVSVVDLGCGDFRIGKSLIGKNVSYRGVDVVEALIEENQKKYSGPNITFACLDITSDTLPDGDVCIIKQVLQHLSNGQIKKILEKTKKYQYVFVSETYPLEVKSYNIDKVHGKDTRFLEGSAIDLQKEPFNVVNVKLVMDVPWDKEERIKTFLIENK
jgi:2-polyprenyl-3-methyl-5-hydroxy-6-metoxy-1,4-benzoquinol methylase